ncbi:ATP-binding protein [Succinivibrio dextrinosolvens]|uniref:ATP-binding protein n=1 Tax=Succinivibrio dextrinosolvens TaxID=83771 RepID=UPI0004E1393B|nr:ATP-binding protein [Succinivibrio dextrinosolvens]
MFPKKESLQIEFKDDSRDSFNFDDVIRACIGLSNAEGGVVFCGIKDNGEVVGSRVALKRGIAGVKYSIRENTDPSIDCDVEIINYKENCSVVKITVPKGNVAVGSRKGLYVKRVLDAKGNPSNSGMSLDSLINTVGRVGARDLTSQALSGLSIKEIDLDLVALTAKKIVDSNQSSEADVHIFSQAPMDILRTLGLINRDDVPNIACLLLFGYEDSLIERMPNHFLQYQVFIGEGNELVKNEKYSSPIAKLLPQLLSFPELNRKSNEIIIDGRSVVIPEYAPNSVREAIANALNHRDYTLHSGIQVQVFPKELIICSAGGFVSGIDIDKLLNTPPNPRNRRLNDAMMRLKLVESSGRGIDTIYFWQAKYGRPAPDYSMSDSTKVEVVLAGGTANLDFVREMISVDVKNVYQMLILNSLFLKNSMSLDEISEIVQLPVSRTKNIVADMINSRLIYPIGPQKETYLLYKQNNGPRKLSRNESEVLRQNILDELKKSGSLTKTELSKLLFLSDSQTYRLLSALKSEGKIEIDSTSKSWRIKE